MDYVRLYRIAATSISHGLTEETEDKRIYSIHGTYLGNKELLYSLQPGVYIVCQGRYVKKLIIK